MVAALSLSTGGTAHARPAIDTDSLVPGGIIVEDSAPDIPDFSPGSFDIEFTSDFATHCEADDGTFTFSFENNYSNAGIVPANRWVAISVEDAEETVWTPYGQPFPIFAEYAKGEADSFTVDAKPGSYEVTVTFYLSLRPVDPADSKDLIAEMIDDDEVFWQDTVRVDCTPDEPVETTEETPTEEVEESEVDEAIVGSPLFTG